jgi:hypothetical protein
MTGNIVLNDNVKSIYGTASDGLEIYHDSNNSYIKDSGTGTLKILTNGLEIKNAADNGYMAFFGSTGGSQLYFNTVQKLETTNTGVSITGALSTTTNVSIGNNAFFIDDGKALFGAAYDLQIYHNGSNSYIKDTGSGGLRITTNQFRVYNAAEDNLIINAVENGAVELYFDDSKKLETVTDGAKVTGNLEVTGTITGSGGSFLPLAGGTMTGDISLVDNVKAKFGDSSDLQIFHDGSNSYIAESGTGSLYVQGSNIIIQSSINKNAIICGDSDSVELYFNAAKKFETTSTGISVTGGGSFTGNVEVGANNINFANNGKARFGNQANLQIYSDGSNSFIDNTGVTQSTIFRVSDNFSLDTTALTISRNGDLTTGRNVTVAGDLTVNGTTTTVNSQTLAVVDPLIQLAKDNTANSLDIGVYGDYNDGTDRFLGLFSDASDGNKFKLFKGTTVEPTTTVNIGGAGYVAADLQVAGLEATSFTNTGDLLVEDNIYLTDAGTTRAKIQLNSSDRDNLDIKAVSLGSIMNFFTADTLALSLDPSQNASFAGTVTAATYYKSSGTSAVLGTNAIGEVLLRPTSSISSTAQSSFTTTLATIGTNATFAGDVKVNGGNVTIKKSVASNETMLGIEQSGAGTSTLGSITYDQSDDAMRLLNNSDFGGTSLILGTRGQDIFKIDYSGNSTFTGSVSSGGNLIVNNGNQLILNNSINTAAGSIVCPGGGSLALRSYGNNMIYLNENAEIKFSTSSVERLNIASDGSITGTNSASNLVLGNAAVGDIYLGGGNGNTQNIIFQAGSEAMSIASGGLVNITNAADYSLRFSNQSAYNSNINNGIVFNGKYTSGGNVTDMASVRGGKENTVDGDFGGKLTFYTRTNGGVDTERMRIDSSGNVGINETSPSSYFSPDLVVKAKADLGGITIRSNATTDNNYLMFADGASGNTKYRGYVNYNHSADSMTFGSAAVARMTIDNSGKLTLNEAYIKYGTNGSGYLRLESLDTTTTSMGIKLISVLGENIGAIYSEGTASNSVVALQSGDGNSSISIAQGTDIKFRIASSDKMKIDSSGRVGIGADPADWAINTGGGSLRIGSNGHIQDDSNSTYYAHNLYYNAGWKFLDSNAHKANYILMADDGTMQFSNTSNTGTAGEAATVVERMRITSAGEFGFGTSSDTVVNGSVYIKAVDVANTVIKVGHKTGSVSGADFTAFYYNNLQIGGVAQSGTTAVSFNTSSDYRLKEDLQDFAGLDMVSKIPVYDYKWKSDESRSYGVVAHELQEVLPQAVTGEKDAEEMQSVDYSKIVPLLVKSIQELTAKVEMLEKNCQCKN